MGGMLGGLLGGMLFPGLGFGGGHGGMGGGGIGLFEILLLAGLAYGIYWMVQRRRQQLAAEGGGVQAGPYAYSQAAALEAAPGTVPEADAGLRHVRQMDPGFDEAAFREACTDTFFKIQAAWMRRDLDGIRPLLTEEMQAAFRTQFDGARAKRRINHLENITVRSVEVTEAWQEQGKDFITVRFLANLLDYTVDEASGRVVDGSDSTPVKFEEYWTWARPVGPRPWQLSAITQAG
jgi:predicted lipid-binding transport protein (Tim44 family)